MKSQNHAEVDPAKPIVRVHPGGERNFAGVPARAKNRDPEIEMLIVLANDDLIVADTVHTEEADGFSRLNTLPYRIIRRQPRRRLQTERSDAQVPQRKQQLNPSWCSDEDPLRDFSDRQFRLLGVNGVTIQKVARFYKAP